MKKEYSPMGDFGAGVVKIGLTIAFAGSVVGAGASMYNENARKQEIAAMNDSFSSIDMNRATKDIEVAPN